MVKNWNAYKASEIVEYYKIYNSYLLDNDLRDDTDSITVDQLVDFVENHILNLVMTEREGNYLGVGITLGAILFGIIFCILMGSAPNSYKAQVLESNTIVYIKDSTHTYDIGDMVWVNLDTKYVDNTDSTAMKCLIIKPM